jgi:hypothetical protein
MMLHLKFAADVGEADRRKVSRDARKLGARSLRPMFPGRKGAALKQLYVLELNDDAETDQVVSELRRHTGVESVEPELRRYLALS